MGMGDIFAQFIESSVKPDSMLALNWTRMAKMALFGAFVSAPGSF
jgi:hypothetical protein